MLQPPPGYRFSLATIGNTVVAMRKSLRGPIISATLTAAAVASGCSRPKAAARSHNGASGETWGRAARSAAA